ncbi:MAG: Uncharacterized protein FD145_996 [Candidatus Saganbacteria bacterium]|uniref:Mannosyl-glycoprotein endo-beta-N-acetylglucosamidase-like domain-containing protein n=1 Tax=Candidatus Saganbacteria bacterium TaxID=2575572 RepID=A0A833L0Z3_UNCSA|nr:MAG: Uncharacterized protein FD145_996 [Candidatus Saganbacteria bacterium]
MRKLILFASIMLMMFGFSAYSDDIRVLKLEKFLSRYPFSPLISHTNEIVYCADKFGLDYRLYVAIAGAESSFGKRYPKHNSNLTGVLNGSKKFKSIYDNIHETHKIIATGKWYKKYRRTKDIKDLVYTYKGVPPYDRYIRAVKYTLHEINSIKIFPEQTPPQYAERF